MSNVYHASIEGAQHGPKGLKGFLEFAKKSGAVGAQPSCYMLEDGKGGFKTAAEVKSAFEAVELKIDGFSCHCPLWVHTTAWTKSPTILPFVPPAMGYLSVIGIEKWAETYMLNFMDLSAELGVKILPTFWGVAFGWEMATGYPWGFWSANIEGHPRLNYDLLKQGQDRFVEKTAKIRAHANKLGIYLAHEIHPGTAAMTADDFNMLVDICDGDKCLAVNADPSHCWEGESWEQRFLKVGSRIYAAHIKNFVIRSGFPLRIMKSAWQDRAMQFVDLPSGDINMQRYAETLITIGYPARYRKITGAQSAPLVVEAESAHKDLDFTSANGIGFVRDQLCWPGATGSFEDGMGA